MLFLFRHNKPPIHPNTNFKLKLAHIDKVIEAEMSVVVEVVERINIVIQNDYTILYRFFL